MSLEQSPSELPLSRALFRPPAFRVLVVCRANHCRSPLMEHLLRCQSQLRDLDWDVSSAGVEALAGTAPHPFVTRILARRGISTVGWGASQVDREAIAGAQLILTASESHRGAILRLDPQAMGRTFTLLQFAHLAHAIRPSDHAVSDATYGAWLLEEVHRLRPRVQPLPRPERDVADPMGHSLNRFRKCAQTIDDAFEAILAPGPAAHWAWES
jgi:protein-tyrosine phosphatase